MPDIISRGAETAVSPPLPEDENPMSLEEAISIVNTVVTTQYRAFDKVRAVLDTSARTKAAQGQADATLADTLRQIDECNNGLKDARSVLDATKQKINQTRQDLVDLQQRFNRQQDDLSRQLAEAKDQADADLAAWVKSIQEKRRVEVENSITAETKKLTALQQKTKEAQAGLDKLNDSIAAKNLETDAVNEKLNSAKAALSQLMAKLGG